MAEIVLTRTESILQKQSKNLNAISVCDRYINNVHLCNYIEYNPLGIDVGTNDICHNLMSTDTYTYVVRVITTNFL